MIFALEYCTIENSLRRTYQVCSRTISHAAVCTSIQTAIWHNKGMRTFLDTKFAVGRFLLRTGNGPDQPTGMRISNFVSSHVFCFTY